MQQKITLIVHKPLVVFHWGKAIFSRFQKNQKKYGIVIKVIEGVSDIFETRYSGFVFLLGIDLKWIDSVIEYIDNPRLHIVLLLGESLKYDSKISHINFDNQNAIKEIIEMLHKKHRTKPAFFGVQKNDTAYADKANAFAMQYSRNNIYHTNGDIEECFAGLYERISEYDSVICANDIIAVYLCKRCRECGISIPEQIYVVGNGGLWIADHIKPSLTTVAYNWESMTDVALQTINSIVNAANLSSFGIKIKMKIVDRESTGGIEKCKNSVSEDYPIYKNIYSENNENIDENLNKIKEIDSVFSSLSPLDRRIVAELVRFNKYEDISSRLFVAIDTIRYHIKKIYKTMGIHTVQELRDIIDSYQIKV